MPLWNVGVTCKTIWSLQDNLTRWNECARQPLEAGKRAYYAFENTCKHEEIKCWVLKKYLFDVVASLQGGSMGW